MADLYVQAENYPAALKWLDHLRIENINTRNEDIRTSLVEYFLYKGFVNEKRGDLLAAKKKL